MHFQGNVQRAQASIVMQWGLIKCCRVLVWVKCCMQHGRDSLCNMVFQSIGSCIEATAGVFQLVLVWALFSLMYVLTTSKLILG